MCIFAKNYCFVSYFLATMKKISTILIIGLCVIAYNHATAQTVTTEGTDFWVAFMENADTTQGDQSLSIFATPLRNYSITVTNPNTGWTQTQSIAPSGINQIYVPLAQAYTVHSGIVENKGIHVTSTDTITLYAITRGYPNQDYTNILPTQMLLDDYIVQTFPQDRFSTEFAIVAAEDNTTVDITLTGYTMDGHTNGQTYSIFLPLAGKMCQVQSTRPGDLSGSRITARNGKKIAVFNGDACAYIPNQNTGNSCDHVVEQALPIDYWGKKFVAIGSQRNRTDYVRITALNNNCVIHKNGSVISTLTAGSTYQYQMSSNNAIDYIETSQPAMVYLYFSSLNGNGNGDPSMTTIPPIDQGIDRVAFSAVSSGNITSHYVYLICPNEAVGSILLDNTAISSSQFNSIPSFPSHKYIIRQVAQGTHHITDTSHNGFVVYLYGFGNRESYGYTIGTAARIISNAYMTVGGENTFNHPNGFDLCPGQDPLYEIRLDGGQLTNVLWDFGDGSPSSTANPTNHPFNNEGEYNVCAYVSYIADTITNEILHDTLCTTIRLHPEYIYDIYESVVENDLPFSHAGVAHYEDVESDTIRRASRYGCDSIEIFHLKVWHNDTITFDTLICDTLLPFTWHGIEFVSDSTHIIRLPNMHGADSLIIVTLVTIPCTIPEPPPSAIPDSSVIDTNTIWIPNVFTPDRNANREFLIKGNNLLDAEILIFHRWGTFVTRFDGLTESWDGTKDGKPCPSGAYVYKIIYHFQSEPLIKKVMVGTVVLLR